MRKTVDRFPRYDDDACPSAGVVLRHDYKQTCDMSLMWATPLSEAHHIHHTCLTPSRLGSASCPISDASLGIHDKCPASGPRGFRDAALPMLLPEAPPTRSRGQGPTPIKRRCLADIARGRGGRQGRHCPTLFSFSNLQSTILPTTPPFSRCLGANGPDALRRVEDGSPNSCRCQPSSRHHMSWTQA